MAELTPQERERLAVNEHRIGHLEGVVGDLSQCVRSIDRNTAQLLEVEKNNSQRHKETMETMGRAFQRLEKLETTQRDSEGKLWARVNLAHNRLARWGGGGAAAVGLLQLYAILSDMGVL